MDLLLHQLTVSLCIQCMFTLIIQMDSVGLQLLTVLEFGITEIFNTFWCVFKINISATLLLYIIARHHFCYYSTLLFTFICWCAALLPQSKNCAFWLVSVPATVLMKDRTRHKLVSNEPLPSLSTDASWLRECESSVSQAGRLHSGDMSAYILQHSVRRTVNISSLQTSNSGGSLGPPTLTTQTGQGTGLQYMHEIYWGFLLQCKVPIQSSHISLGQAGRG